MISQTSSSTSSNRREKVRRDAAKFSDIFKKELFDLEKARFIGSSGKYAGNELYSDYLDLVAKYEKNLDTMMMLTRISDSQQVYLQETQEELRQTLAKLEKEMDERMDELVVAKHVQKSMIPSNFKAPPPLNIKAALKPVTEVSGDYYDIFMIDDRRVGVLVADVCGHGVPSALITAMAKFTFINESKNSGDTGEICEAVNRLLYNALTASGFFFTTFFIIIDTVDLTATYTNAGHHKAFVLGRDPVSLTEIDSRGSPIGIDMDLKFGSETIGLSPGDRIYIYTDGIVEARNSSGEFYEHERLASLILDNSDMDIGDFCDFIMKDVELFCTGSSIDDDRTILAVEILPGIRR